MSSSLTSECRGRKESATIAVGSEHLRENVCSRARAALLVSVRVFYPFPYCTPSFVSIFNDVGRPLCSESNLSIPGAMHETICVTKTCALALALFRATSRSSSTRPFAACARHLCRIWDHLFLLQHLRTGLGTIVDLSETEAAASEFCQDCNARYTSSPTSRGPDS